VGGEGVPRVPTIVVPPQLPKALFFFRICSSNRRNDCSVGGVPPLFPPFPLHGGVFFFQSSRFFFLVPQRFLVANWVLPCLIFPRSPSPFPLCLCVVKRAPPPSVLEQPAEVAGLLLPPLRLLLLPFFKPKTWAAGFAQRAISAFSFFPKVPLFLPL